MSKIEQIITEIEELIEGSRLQPFSQTKIIVNKDEIEELLAELRMKTPDEIKKYQKMISNKDAILNDAKERAEAMIAQATEHTTELVSEHEIMQQAYIQANDVINKATEEAQRILDAATNDANEIRSGAMQYTDDCLANLQNIISHSMENIQARYDVFMKSMSTSMDVVTTNREELNPQQVQEEEQSPVIGNQTASTSEYDEELEDYTVNLDDQIL